MSSAGEPVFTPDTTASGLSTFVRDPRVGAISASGSQMYSRKCASGRLDEGESEAPNKAGARAVEFGDDVAEHIMNGIDGAVVGARVGDDARNQLLEAVTRCQVDLRHLIPDT